LPVETLPAVTSLVETLPLQEPTAQESPAQEPAAKVDPLTEVLAALRENAARFESLVNAVAGLQTIVAESLTVRVESAPLVSTQVALVDAAFEDQTEILQSQIDRLTEQLISTIEDRDYLSERCDELKIQNEALNASRPVSSVRHQIEKLEADALSWEDRKAIILRQMESDSFDADSFVMTIADEKIEQSDQDSVLEDPIGFVQSLLEKVDRLNDENQQQRSEVKQLQHMLEERPPILAGSDSVAVGAVALMSLLDDNELVKEERLRLQELQATWEEQFRKIEIETSLERAKLSRERQELANRLAEAENEVEHLRRSCRTEIETGGASRKWLAKLGIGADNN
jgi:hypothetical protein